MRLQEYIEYMLSNHKRIRESIDMIRRNILSERIDRDDIIEGLSMPGMGYDSVRVCPTNVVSDRVTSIIDRIPREISELRSGLGELRAKIDLQEYELRMFDRAVTSLSEPARHVILLMYFDSLSWREVREKTGYSGGTLSNYRSKGIHELVQHYKKYCTKMMQNELIGIEL